MIVAIAGCRDVGSVTDHLPSPPPCCAEHSPRPLIACRPSNRVRGASAETPAACVLRSGEQPDEFSTGSLIRLAKVFLAPITCDKLKSCYSPVQALGKGIAFADGTALLGVDSSIAVSLPVDPLILPQLTIGTWIRPLEDFLSADASVKRFLFMTSVLTA